MISVLASIFGVLGIVVGGYFALFGTRDTNRVTNLDKAAGWWEKAVANLEERIVSLENKSEKQGEELTVMREAYSSLRDGVKDTIRLLQENIEHETSEKAPPPPNSMAEMLKILQDAIRGTPRDTR